MKTLEMFEILGMRRIHSIHESHATDIDIYIWHLYMSICIKQRTTYLISLYKILLMSFTLFILT